MRILLRMIYELSIKNPKNTPVLHWGKVSFLSKPMTLEFAPGLNIMFGPNGSGKSTIIDGLATMLHCREGNWPAVTKTSVRAFLRPDGKFATGLHIEHDGQPARYLGIQTAAFVPEKGVAKVKLAMSEGEHLIGRAAGSMSSGQASVTKLVRFLRHDAVKTKYVMKTSSVGGEFKPLWEAAVQHLKAAKARPGMPKQQTILLDEVDHNLDFAHQMMVWKTLRSLVEDGKHQVIVASHSPFAVNVPGAHYIETSPGYLEASRGALRYLFEEDADIQKKAG